MTVQFSVAFPIADNFALHWRYLYISTIIIMESIIDTIREIHDNYK